MKNELIGVVLVSLFVSGCSNKLSFDIDINELSYTLPEHTMICLPEKKQLCTADGCKDIKPTVFVLYNEDTNLIYRCDNKPCDEYETKSIKSWLYTNIEPLEPKGFLVKLSDDWSYIETVTLGLEILISQWKCK